MVQKQGHTVKDKPLGTITSCFFSELLSGNQIGNNLKIYRNGGDGSIRNPSNLLENFHFAWTSNGKIRLNMKFLSVMAKVKTIISIL